MLSTVRHDLLNEAPEVQMLFPWENMRPAAQHDDLTKLATRRRLAAHLRSPAMRADIARGVVGVQVIDIDNLKEINARFGHDVGDAVICHMADILRAQSAPHDLVGRTGGDEFTVICTRTDRAGLQRQAEAVRAAAGRPFRWQGRTLRVGACVGTCLGRGASGAGEDMIQSAEMALGVSKASGRGCAPAPATTGTGSRRGAAQRSVRGASAAPAPPLG